MIVLGEGKFVFTRPSALVIPRQSSTRYTDFYVSCKYVGEPGDYVRVWREQNWTYILTVMPYTEFERLVAKLKLKPDEYERSKELREWALRNMRNHFVPEDLLAAWKLQLQEEEADSAVN